MIATHIGVGVGIGLARTQYRITITDGYYTDDGRLNQTLAIVPVSLHLVTSAQKNICVFADIGGTFSFLLKVRGIMKNYWGDSLAYTTTNSTTGGINKFTFWPFLSAGLSVRLSEMIKLNVGPKLQYQLSNNLDQQNPEDIHLMAYYFNTAVTVQLPTKEKRIQETGAGE